MAPTRAELIQAGIYRTRSSSGAPIDVDVQDVPPMCSLARAARAGIERERPSSLGAR